MKMKTWIILSVILLVAAGALLWFAVLRGGGDNRIQAQDHVHGSAPAVSEPATTQEQEAPTVEIPGDKQRLIGLKTVPAALIPMKKIIRLNGLVESDEQMLFTVNTKVEGWVERLYADYTGRYLKKGDPLLQIYSPDLLAAQQELINLKSWRTSDSKGTSGALLPEDSERVYAAARQRLKLWDITDAQIDQLEKTGKPVRTLTIFSQVSGYVVKRYATQGMKVMPGEPLLDIADLSKVWVVIEVSQPDIALIKKGLTARISFDGMPGKVFTAPIDFVYPDINPDTRTLKARCMLANPSGIFKPKMFATVEIAADLGNRLAVPGDAVLDTGERQIVYVDKGEGNFEPREVTAGLRSDDMREIVSGLKNGERVVASALFLIDSEAQLKGVAPLSK
ncbi:MAG: efflux RND transporter periplasmic adaptor subunit [Desulfomonilia bacterium]|jgi:Cu(I)/Ag(I) efflux system membrane fusion protein